MEPWVDFKLDVSQPAVKTAERPGLTVTVVGEAGEVFHRRALKIQGALQTQESMLVARLNGVSVYVRDGRIMVTTEDVYL